MSSSAARLSAESDAIGCPSNVRIRIARSGRDQDVLLAPEEGVARSTDRREILFACG